MDINLDDLYAILAEIARNQDQITYGQLSQRYYDRTQDWHEPHGSWDEPLGELNQILHNVGWAPLSSVVVLDDDNREPGGGFWASSPNIPARPTNNIARIAQYGQLLGLVHGELWPAAVPTSPPV